MLDRCSQFDRLAHLLTTDREWTVSPRLEPLLRNLVEALSPPLGIAWNVEHVRGRLIELLRYLCQETNPEADQAAVAEMLLAENEWELDWAYLPDPVADVLFELSATEALPRQPRSHLAHLLDQLRVDG